MTGDMLLPEGRALHKAIAALLFVWAGVLLGISFVATPAKFLAPSLPMVQALDVGRWTFHVLAWIEWGFVLVAASLGICITRRTYQYLPFGFSASTMTPS